MTEPDRPGSEIILAALQRTLAANPKDRIARHNLGVELRRLDRSTEALVEIERALAEGLKGPETMTMHAHLLADLGRFEEAVDRYRQVVTSYPETLDAHETLARLLPQIGRGAEALDSYHTALAKAPRSGLLRVSALGTAKALHDHDRLLDWAREGEAIFGPDTMISVLEATALSALGQDGAARDLLIRSASADPLYAPAHLTLAHVLIRLGEYKAAEVAALEAAQLDPLDQSAWALLTLVWRLLDDAREHWLADYERLVMTIDLPGIDLAALEPALVAQHLVRNHPGEQSLRGGTQTRGNLFDKRDPLIVALATHIRREVEARISKLPKDATHPFLRRNTGSIAFAGSWSVRLKSQGFHISHIHQSGWLSSAYYIALPPEMGAGEAGALMFGVPDAALGLDLSPRCIVAPLPGRLVIFPSYFWHGTVPFESESARLTVAFDALPVDSAALGR